MIYKLYNENIFDATKDVLHRKFLSRLYRILARKSIRFFFATNAKFYPGVPLAVKDLNGKRD